MSASNDTQEDEIILDVSLRLPKDGDSNQDLLFDLAHGVPIEELASRYSSGNISNVRSRILLQYGRLGISLPYTEPHAMHILRCALEL